MQGRCSWETQVVSLVLLGSPGVTGRPLLVVSQFSHLYKRNGYAERSYFPEGHCGPGTATCSRALPTDPRDKVQHCVVLPELLSKATVTGCYQDVPCHDGSSIYGIAAYRTLRFYHGFVSLWMAS